MAKPQRKTIGFTLVELLVVIAILGILMGLLLPAVGSVKDSMRRAQCKNNLAQIGRGAQAHLTKQGHFPSSGWGYLWTGDPDRGFGMRQPGGWIYNLLPYVGLDTIHDVAKGLQGDGPGTAKYAALAESRSAAIPFLICPTRRKAIAYPYPSNWGVFNSAAGVVCSKTDYAANGGSNQFLDQGPISGTNSVGCLTSFPNCTWYVNSSGKSMTQDQLNALLCDPTTGFNGVSGIMSEVSNIPDGQANVFFAGEKSLMPSVYYTGTDAADNDTCLEGNDWDVNRWVSTAWFPTRDTAGVDSISSFGSAHAQGCHFVFCDGHVQLISYQVDRATYQSLGVTNDGTVSENY